MRPGLWESLDSLLGDPLNLRKGQDDGWGSGKGLLGGRGGVVVNEHQGFLGKGKKGSGDGNGPAHRRAVSPHDNPEGCLLLLLVPFYTEGK